MVQIALDYDRAILLHVWSNLKFAPVTRVTTAISVYSSIGWHDNEVNDFNSKVFFYYFGGDRC